MKFIRTVNYYETDKMQVTHHSNYVRFMEEARVAFLNEMGFGFDKLEAEGMISPVVSFECNLKSPTTFADTIEIETGVLSVTAAKFEIGYTMTCKGKLVCTAKSVHCVTDKNGRPIAIKKNFPDFFKMLQDNLN